MTGIAVYAVGVLVQLPFISTAFYTGPLVDKLDGADISWIVGSRCRRCCITLPLATRRTLRRASDPACQPNTHAASALGVARRGRRATCITTIRRNVA